MNIILSLLRIFIVPFLIWSIVSVCWGATVSPSVPLDSWVYPALDKLTGMGFIDSRLCGNRPFTRIEAVRQVQEAARNIKRTDDKSDRLSSSTQHNITPVAQELLSRLEKEFSFETAQKRGMAVGYFKPLRDPRFKYFYREGQLSRIPFFYGDNQSNQYSLNYNNDGVDYAENNNLQLTFEADARIASFLLFDVRPIILFNDNNYEDNENFTISTLSAVAALGLGPMEISYGQQSLWWGQGRHGSLILTNNAKPLTMFRITNPSPRLLPGFLRYLGPFRIDFFLSRLEEDRWVPEPSFSGLRLIIKPFPWIEIGATRTTMFGGQGRPKIDSDEYLTILTGKNLLGDEDTSNQLAGLDINLKLPFLKGVEIYGEIGGEDEAGGMFTLDGWIVGLYIPKIEPSGRLGLRFEYADVSHTRRPPPPWYQHGIYQSGYTYQGMIMGHHVGTAAWDYFGEIDYYISENLSIQLSADYEIRGNDEDELETHLQGAFGVDWLFAKYFNLHFDYKIDRVDNYNFIHGENRIFQSVSLGFGYNW